ncbi:ADP-ribosyltransferase [Glycomyces buryatensis]|uniref:ADP ribosyltransferase domain-containing protein n=1 Tax=Glycomyces buryatensis TaxID=2570927 RepID=A0A4S8QI67_9ACTN|nr:ADP-ribosyltransferase [Glycomyces buryatensis]THV42952.1 hypothetical protein FAB82_04185 [Glycomyces buryatensis]
MSGTLPRRGSRGSSTPGSSTPSSGTPGPTFTKADEDAVRFYTSDAYEPLNGYLRNPSSVTDPAQRAKYDRQAEEISRGLAHLPADPGTTHRGAANGPWVDQYQTGQVVPEAAFSSSSKDPMIAQEFAEKNARKQGTEPVIFEIEGKNGRYIKEYSIYDYEEEVAFDRGTSYLVTDRYDAPDGSIIYIKMTEQ